MMSDLVACDELKGFAFDECELKRNWVRAALAFHTSLEAQAACQWSVRQMCDWLTGAISNETINTMVLFLGSQLPCTFVPFHCPQH